MNDVNTSGGSEVTPEETVTAARTPRRHRSRFVVAGAVLLLAILGVVIGTSLSSNSSAGAAVVVRDALSSTLATNTLAYKEDMNISLAGQNLGATGSGACNLSSGDCDFALTYGGALSSLGSVNAILSGGVIYMELSPTLRSQLPTPWISIALSKNPSASSLGSSENPLAGLSLLADQGAVVTSDGTVSVNGQTMSQYSVSISPSTVHRLATASADGLPKWMVSAAARATPGAASETVDIDSTGKLAVVDLSMTEAVSGQTAAVSVTLNVTGYGVPVNVTVPPSSQVTSVTSSSQLGSL